MESETENEDIGTSPITQQSKSAQQDSTQASATQTPTQHQPIPKKSQQIKTAKPRPHVCSVCTRAFARLEHLKRHERSHTNEKPFQCAACGRCFARRDLVLRHQQKLHSNLPLHRAGNGAKDSENEHIIILTNNTSANAPLPVRPDYQPELYGHSEPATAYQNFVQPQQLHQLPTQSQTGYPAASDTPSSYIPSPASHMANTPAGSIANSMALPPTSSGAGSHGSIDSPRKKMRMSLQAQLLANTPINSVNVNNTNNNSENIHNNSTISNNFNHYEEYLPQNRQFRHQSYSAVSGISYANHKDELNILNNKIPEIPGQVEFSTPQFTATELTSKALPSALDLSQFGSGIDWNNIDSLDLNVPFKVSSIVNLQALANRNSEFNLNGLVSKGSALNLKLDQAQISQNLQQLQSQGGLNLKNNVNYFSAHHFLDPSHPHHIRGTTPFEIGMGGVGTDSIVGIDQMIGDSANSKDFLTMPERKLARQQLPNLNVQDSSSASSSDSPHSGIKHKSDTSRSSVSGSTQGQSTNILLEDGRIDMNQFNIGASNSNSSTNSRAPSDPIPPKSINNNHASPDDWLREIMKTPFESNFPTATHHIGFIHSPNTQAESPKSIDDISGMFRNRQLDLFNQRFPPHNHQQPQAQPEDQQPTVIPQSNGPTLGSIMTKEMRNKILLFTNLSNLQFPPLEDLNSYMNLYEENFDKYFPFVHIPTLIDQLKRDTTFENIPLVLSIAAIGAIYSFHGTNGLSLFNISKLHIHKFFENSMKGKKNFSDMPLMAFQCLVLHIFITLFLSDDGMIEISARQIRSMRGLIESNSFNKDIQNVPQSTSIYNASPSLFQSFSNTPVSNTNTNSSSPGNFANDKTSPKAYEHFILAQSRIRTLHCFYVFQLFRSCLIGDGPILLHGESLDSGSFASDQTLWKIENAQVWESYVSTTTNKKTLAELSNSVPMDEILTGLNNCYYNQGDNNKISLRTSLTTALYLHDKIRDERNRVGQCSALQWKRESRPPLEALVRSWEAIFVKSGGIFSVNKLNCHILSSKEFLKIILPVYFLAKIRLSVDTSCVMRCIFSKNWDSMNKNIEIHFKKDYDALFEAALVSLDILDLWTQTISVANDPLKTSLSTPVFFLGTLCMSILIVSSCLEMIENKKSLPYSTNERLFWLRCEEELKEADSFLSLSNGGYKKVIIDTDEVKNLIKSNNDFDSNDDVIQKLFIKANLSEHVLHIGIRILTDAPIWPVAVLLAESLKRRTSKGSQKN